MKLISNLPRVLSALPDAGFDSLIIADEVNVRYASGLNIPGAAGFISGGAALIFGSAEPPADCGAWQYARVRSRDELYAALRDAISSAGSRSPALCDGVRAVDSRKPSTALEDFSAALGLPIKDATAFITNLRAVKSEDEMEAIVSAQRISERALDYVLGIIRPGITELEITAALDAKMLEYGAEATAFNTIAISGAKTAEPHGVASDDKIKYGDFVVMDFGCVYNGYCSDMTRTVAVGKADERMCEVYAIVLEAQKRAIATMTVGASGRDVDAAARDYISASGYDGKFVTALGHSLGLSIHEYPLAALRSDPEDVLEPGMVLTAEPGIYLPGEFGVRIEDIVFIRDGGGKSIARAPKELIVL